MDKQQYHDKALSLLNDKSTYAVLNSDPTSKTQIKLNKMLLDLKKAGKHCYFLFRDIIHLYTIPQIVDSSSPCACSFRYALRHRCFIIGTSR